jgi:hypothetical protein
MAKIRYYLCPSQVKNLNQKQRGGSRLQVVSMNNDPTATGGKESKLG